MARTSLPTAAALLALGALLPLPALAETGSPASAVILDASGQEVGKATFEEGPRGVVLRLSVGGLPPGMHAMHLHAKGDCDDHDHGFQASSGHVNPDDRQHGFLNPDGPDAGDLPNFRVDPDGSAEVEAYSTMVTLAGAEGRAMLLDEDGTALVIHANPDDYTTQPIGGAGDRIACGVLTPE